MVAKSNSSLVITKEEIRKIVKDEIKSGFSEFTQELSDVLTATANIIEQNKDK